MKSRSNTMFEDRITVRRGEATYNATQIPLRKEIFNGDNSHHIRIQTYLLTQKIDELTVVILQLKYIPMDQISASSHHQSTFFDQVWFQHKSRSFLEYTIKVLFRAFDCDDFIQYYNHKNQFKFKFEAKQNMIIVTKSISLPRKQYTKNEATILLNDRFKTIQPRTIAVHCINSHEIMDINWDFEVDLTLLPGKYKCYLNEIFGNAPIHIHVRDHLSIRNVYEHTLKADILINYLNHLGNIDSPTKMMEWNKCGFEIAPLFNLCSILCKIDKTHYIWDNLFKICTMNEIDNTIIRNIISQQTVADFIVLSLTYYVQNNIKQRVKTNKENKKVLLESERYILSVILPYFPCGASVMDKYIGNELLMSGLFNQVCKPLIIGNNKEHTNENDKWYVNIEPLSFKQKLLEYLHIEQCDVIKQYYVATLQYTPALQSDNPTQWTFYIRPLTHCEIHSTQIVFGYFKKYVQNQVPNDIILVILRFFCGTIKQVNMHAECYKDYFEFKQRNISGMHQLNLIIKCIDVSFEYEWTLWTKKRLKLYTASLGYWKILPSWSNESPVVPYHGMRVPVEHLDCMLSLFRHNSMNISSKLFSKENYFVSVVFLQNKNDNINYNCWTEENVEAEYRLTFWNGSLSGNTALSLKLIKAANPIIDKKHRLKMRDSHYMHFKSHKNAEWLWYDNESARYKEYSLTPSVPKQFEASYQGVCEEMFPLEIFNRANQYNRGRGSVTERLFNCAQLPNMSAALVEKLSYKWKPFVLRFSFLRFTTDIINIEQLAINSYYDQYPINVKRIVTVCEKPPVIAVDESELRISSIGKMIIHHDQAEKVVIIRWEFERNARLYIKQRFCFKIEMCMSQQKEIKRILDYWRTNVLFEVQWKNKAINVVLSKMWKSSINNNMPPIINMIPLFI
eukprot:29358_1